MPHTYLLTQCGLPWKRFSSPSFLSSPSLSLLPQFLSVHLGCCSDTPQSHPHLDGRDRDIPEGSDNVGRSVRRSVGRGKPENQRRGKVDGRCNAINGPDVKGQVFRRDCSLYVKGGPLFSVVPYLIPPLRIPTLGYPLI